MNKKYFIFFICFIIFLAVIFTSVAIFSNTNNDNKKKKAEEQISYMEIKILGMLNSLNNIPFSNSILLEQNTIKGQENSGDSSSKQGSSQGSEEEKSGSEESSKGSSNNTKNTDHMKYNVENKNILNLKENNIDWEYIKNTVEVLHSSWATIMVDLHSLNINNNDILAFSNNLDALIINIQSEDKRTTLNSLATLYALLPVYISQFSDNSDKINIAYTKSYIINSYVLLEDDKWDEMQAEITKAGEYFGIIINSVNERNTQSFINKIYVLLNEIKNSINLKDKKLYYMKYKNLMENAMNI